MPQPINTEAELLRELILAQAELVSVKAELELCRKSNAEKQHIINIVRMHLSRDDGRQERLREQNRNNL